VRVKKKRRQSSRRKAAVGARYVMVSQRSLFTAKYTPQRAAATAR
jgi:hypothetical protein